MLGERTAKALDSLAEKAYAVGVKVGGETGGRVADAVNNTVLGPVRSRCDAPCWCGEDHDHE